MTTRAAMATRPTRISVREASTINETVQILKRLGGAKDLANDLERWVERRVRHDALTAPKEATVWLLLSTDPNRMLDEKPEVGFELPDDERIVTLHPDFDDVLDHIRRTYDPNGQYSDEGSGSMQNYLHLEGYEFDYKEVKLSELGF